ncbi:hypothetical protein GCM10010446_26300 [Streptomyces enissocaesilis]|uniref:Uncharacterized protein n=1 Tax=Streptomyces enissocaesilis TaxID=332589 RepID=A0ABN3X688_9ACTN
MDADGEIAQAGHDAGEPAGANLGVVPTEGAVTARYGTVTDTELRNFMTFEPLPEALVRP